jgi:precorrin-2 methylase
MIMLMGLLVVGPFSQIHNAAAQSETSTQAIAGAKAANDKAASDLHTMMMHMDSMSKMPMSANEKDMMNMLHQMATIVQMLIDANNHLINAIENRKG